MENSHIYQLTTLADYLTIRGTSCRGKLCVGEGRREEMPLRTSHVYTYLARDASRQRAQSQCTARARAASVQESLHRRTLGPPRTAVQRIVARCERRTTAVTKHYCCSQRRHCKGTVLWPQMYSMMRAAIYGPRYLSWKSRARASSLKVPSASWPDLLSAYCRRGCTNAECTTVYAHKDTFDFTCLYTN